MPDPTQAAPRPLDRLHGFLHRNRIRLGGGLWVTGDSMLVVEGGLSKDPVFAIGSVVITAAAATNTLIGEAAAKYTRFGYIGTGIAYTVDGALRHDPMKMALGAGMVIGTTAMYFGKKIAAEIAENPPSGRLLRKLSGMRSELVGELVYDAVCLPILHGGYKLLESGIAQHAPKDIINGSLLSAAALIFFAGNRIMGLAPPQQNPNIVAELGPRGNGPAPRGPEL